MDKNMAILYMTSSYEKSLLCCYDETKIDSWIRTCLPNKKDQNTLYFIKHAKMRGITDIEVYTRGPLAWFQLLDFKLLESHGIHLQLVKDITPPVHIGVHPPRKRLTRQIPHEN